MTIKANELRIGNLVTWEDEPDRLLKVDEIGYNRQKNRWARFENGDGSIINDESCQVIGIPLTEEWLVRFGFCKSNRLFYSIKVGENFDISICITKGPSGCFGSVAFESLEFNKVLGRMTGTCNYVHQLQNLYFALTNEELNERSQ